ncbi:hypothetical protein PSGK_19010 [Pseudomonas solani]|uniref:hypothetical protein n=1 Tax=Pseudomonas solani TaxID=2731552 RepID=UPI0035BE5443
MAWDRNDPLNALALKLHEEMHDFAGFFTGWNLSAERAFAEHIRALGKEIDALTVADLKAAADYASGVSRDLIRRGGHLMAKRILIALALFAWLSTTAGALFILAPTMFFSPRPEMVLVAFLVPAIWLVLSLLAYIAWADSGWREHWEEPARAPSPLPQAGRWPATTQRTMKLRRTPC